MLRVVLASAGLVLVLITSALGLVRAQPHDVSTLEAVLNAPGCPPPGLLASAERRPCWMGIVIGLTGREEALAVLRAHPWVGEIFESPSMLSWRWNGQQPAVIDAAQNGLISLGVGGGSTVRQMRILTHVPLGEVWLRYGPPDNALLVRPVSPSSVYQIGFYNGQAMQAITSVGCPTRPRSYWYAPTSFGRGDVWTTERINSVQFNIYDSPDWWDRLRRCRP